jgi:uncharacterized membrane protein
MNPTQLSRELRTGRSADLQRRRWMVGLSLLGTAMAQLVAAYQMGLLRRLPDPRGRLGKVFNATKVDASDYAYRRLDTPDGFLMLNTLATTAALAAAGGEDRARTQPWLPLALGAKALYDVVTTARLAREEWQENHALCQYCQVASLASVAVAALAVPEALTAARYLRART